MKKRLLFAALAMVSALGVYADDYVFTPTARFKIAGENIVTNGNFADGYTGWTNDEGQDVDVATWDRLEGEGPNGEAVLVSRYTAGELEGSLCNVWEMQPGTYIISYDIKGIAAGSTSVTVDAANYADFFINTDASLVKGAMVDGYPRNVAESNSWTDAWTTITDTVNIENQGEYLVMHFKALAQETMVTNFSIVPVIEVFDTRILKAKLKLGDAFLAHTEFTTDRDELESMVNQFHLWLDNNDPQLDDVTGMEDIIASYQETLQAFMDANTANYLKNINQGNIAAWTKFNNGDNKKSNGDWVFLGTAQRFGHAADAEFASYAYPGNYNLGEGWVHIVKEGVLPGKYLFALDLYCVKYFKSKTNGSYYTPNYNYFDTESKMFFGADSVDCGVLDNRIPQAYIIEGVVGADGKLDVGVKFAGFGENGGGSYYYGNAILRKLDQTEADINYTLEKDAIALQQAELKKRLDAAREDVLKTKADGFPWGKEALQTAIDENQAIYDQSLTYDESTIRYRLENASESEPKVSDEVLAGVRAMNSARNVFSNLNASYTALIATTGVAEAFIAANTGKGDASRQSALEALIAEAKDMVANTADGSAGDEKEDFDNKSIELTDAQAYWHQSFANYSLPASMAVVNPNFTSNLSGWELSAEDTGKEAYKRGTDADGGHGTVNPEQTYAQVWRGNTASPHSKFMQTRTLKDAGVYEYKASANAWNTNAAYDILMATLLVDDLGMPNDTLWNKSDVKLFFGPVGTPDSVRVHSHYGYPTNNDNKEVGNMGWNGTTRTGYWMSRFSVVYIKKTNDEETVEYGMDSMNPGQIGKAGANTYGFTDNQILFGGPLEQYTTDAKAYLNKVIAEAEAAVSAGSGDPDQLNRLERRMNEAKRALEGEDVLASPWDEKEVDADTKLLINILNTRNNLIEALSDVMGVDAGVNAPQFTPNDRQLARGIFNLAGVKVADSQQTMKNLNKGLYIVDGKKYIVK